MLTLDYALASGSAGLVVVFLLTLPSVYGIISHFRDTKPKPNPYEDEDGVATEKSAASYSATVPKALLSIFSTLGFLASIALAVLATVNEANRMMIENWLAAGQWVRISAFTTERNLLTSSVSSLVSNLRSCAHKRFCQKLQPWHSCGYFIRTSLYGPSHSSWRSGAE